MFFAIAFCEVSAICVLALVFCKNCTFLNCAACVYLIMREAIKVYKDIDVRQFLEMLKIVLEMLKIELEQFSDRIIINFR